MQIKPSRRSQSLLTRYFSFLERRSVADRLLFHILLAVFIGGGLYLLLAFSQGLTIDVPKRGNSMTEGVVGAPRFVNPVLAITHADHDMSTLLFDGLMKLGPNGDLVPNVAESVTISDDGTEYTVTLRKDEFFHDGTQLTAADVAFTVDLIQNSELKSPLRGDWDGVKVDVIDDFTLMFTLPEPYSPFIENLTVGILPVHIWKDIAIEQLPFSEYNTSPIGSGSFAVEDIDFSPTGLITGYHLAASDYENETALFSKLNVMFFGNEDDLLEAVKKGTVDATAGLSSDTLANNSFSNFTEYQLPLPRTFALFYNQNRSAALRDQALREVLSKSIDKNELIATVLDGYGIPTDTPVPPTFGTLQSEDTPSSTEAAILEDKELIAILSKAGWKRNENGEWQKKIDDNEETLKLTIATANTPVFVSSAEYIKERWEKLGIPTTVEQYDQTTLIQSVIRPRSFTVLLFGNDTGRALDLYPFWHSSQREDPGLNVAQYANIDTDSLLRTMRVSHDKEEQSEALAKFIDIISDEYPATFLYTPTFSYLVNEEITIAPLSQLARPSDRFSNVKAWHRGYEALWPFFIKDQN